jgi:AcrR family transcriptional regulator
MDLSKSSFYQAFKSKHDLYAVALNHYMDCMVVDLSERLDSSSSGLEFIESVFLKIAESAPLKASQRGCFLMNTASEFAQNNVEIADLTRSGMKKIEAVFTRAVKKAQAAGEISLSKNAETLANFLICNMSGLKTMVKAGIKPAALRPTVITIVASLK